jgi:hypothetical protein
MLPDAFQYRMPTSNLMRMRPTMKQKMSQNVTQPFQKGLFATPTPALRIEFSPCSHMMITRATTSLFHVFKVKLPMSIAELARVLLVTLFPYYRLRFPAM